MLAFIILALINIIILMKTGQATKVVEGWTVYGTMGCGWTRKQLEHMKKSGKPHTFVDCDKEGCKGMDAYPTLVSPEGEKTVGYKEV
jgi:hypothetical protein|tara:strand:- start:185 stop:445 length:261 start_codon:yes stop_codon:yes gene_type:complete